MKEFVFEDDDVKACVKELRFDIAKPGESVRITPVKDVIEPRVKVEGPGGQFPGVIAKVDTVGTGKTHVLRGMAVVTAGKIVGFQEGIIDMSGPGAEYTPFSKLLQPGHGLRACGRLSSSTSMSTPCVSPACGPPPLWVSWAGM